MPTYYIRGGTSKVSLNERDFVAAGGEKKIYAKAGTAYCVYHQPKDAIPAGKIKELSALNHPGVVVPTAELLDERKQHCGEVMPFVDDSYAPKSPDIKPLVLCQLFTNAFRRKQGIDNSHVVRITDGILDIAQHCHRNRVVLVDPNETNWLVRHDLDRVYLIDTSCVQTQGYPGTAIKPAIRDYSCRVFTAESDYFSLAVVLGWLWVGIHPYLAFHPKWKHLDANAAMVPRMKEHFSFFRADTEFNRACRPFDEIPKGLLGWLRETLDGGKRNPPPEDCGKVGSVSVSKPVAPVQTDQVEIVEIEDCGAEIRGIFGSVVTTDKFWPECVMVRTPQQDRLVGVWSDGRKLHLETEDPGDAPEISVNATRVFAVGGRAYAVSSNAVSEIVFNEPNGTIRATVRKVGNLADLPTTRTYPGCVVQNLLGKYLLSTFPGPGQCVQYQLPDLEGWQILDAKYEGGVFVCAVEQHGQYRMWLYRFGEKSMDVALVSDRLGDVNFAVTELGICAMVEPDGTLRICSAKPGSAKVKRVAFPEPDMQLFARDNKIVGAMGSKVYRITVK